MANDKDKLPEAVAVYIRMRKMERRRILAVQKYWLHVMEKEYRRVKKAHENRLEKRRADREMREKYPTDKDLFDAYIINEITEREYKRTIGRRTQHDRYDEWKFGDRARWLELQIREQKALIADLELYFNAEVPEMKTNKYYDPTRNVSKYNFPRPNWRDAEKVLNDSRRKYYKLRGDRKKRSDAGKKRGGTDA